MNTIVRLANQCVGIKEKSGNSGFSDPGFEAAMRTVGWRPSYAWCMYSCKLWWKAAHTSPHDIALINQLTGSTQQSWEIAKRIFKTGIEPKPGAIGIMRRGEKQGFGHAFLVEDNSMDQAATVEGNIEGSHGQGVHRSNREIDLSPKAKGLFLLGFIYPPGNFSLVDALTSKSILLPAAGLLAASVGTYAAFQNKEKINRLFT